MTESVVNASGPHGKEAKGAGKSRSRESVSEKLIVLFFADLKKLEDPSPKKGSKGLGAILFDLGSVIAANPRLKSMYPGLVPRCSQTDKSSSSGTLIPAQGPQQQGLLGPTSTPGTTSSTQTSQVWGPSPWGSPSIPTNIVGTTYGHPPSNSNWSLQQRPPC